ncbi:hypothetical protein D5F53_14310 [Paenibacillus lautus]|uniref:Uncharacterized protein n=1 Tax=Paenibacillus lautus TaxID=1401 RepID=A0A385TL24_PAELA|nr:hypothetical protein D5F53_14310 [Paenibacillus lautus]
MIILAPYTLIHVMVNYFFPFHSLIPAWKLDRCEPSNPNHAIPRIMCIDGISLASGNSSKWLLSPEQSPKLA